MRQNINVNALLSVKIKALDRVVEKNSAQITNKYK